MDMGLLADWMNRAGETDQTFAPKLEVSRVHVSRLRRVIHNPSPDLAKRLERLTGISAAELIFEARSLADNDAPAQDQAAA